MKRFISLIVIFLTISIFCFSDEILYTNIHQETLLPTEIIILSDCQNGLYSINVSVMVNKNMAEKRLIYFYNKKTAQNVLFDMEKKYTKKTLTEQVQDMIDSEDVIYARENVDTVNGIMWKTYHYVYAEYPE